MHRSMSKHHTCRIPDHRVLKYQIYTSLCLQFHRLFASLTIAGPSKTMGNPLWQLQNPEHYSIFQSYWMKCHIKLMLPTYSFSRKIVHVHYIWSFILKQHQLPARSPILWCQCAQERRSLIGPMISNAKSVYNIIFFAHYFNYTFQNKKRKKMCMDMDVA
jgi:hypothetical protein